MRVGILTEPTAPESIRGGISGRMEVSAMGRRHHRSVLCRPCAGDIRQWRRWLVLVVSVARYPPDDRLLARLLRAAHVGADHLLLTPHDV